MSDLATQTRLRLAAAGIPASALAAVTSHNRQAAQRRAVHVELRRGQFGKTIETQLDADDCGWPSCPDHGQHASRYPEVQP
jgi:hypothetical protein